MKLLFDLSIKSRSVSHNASSLLAGHSSCDGVVEVCLVFMDNSSNRCDFQKKNHQPSFSTIYKGLNNVLQFKELILERCEVTVQEKSKAEAAVKEISISHIVNISGST